MKNEEFQFPGVALKRTQAMGCVSTSLTHPRAATQQPRSRSRMTFLKKVSGK